MPVVLKYGQVQVQIRRMPGFVRLSAAVDYPGLAGLVELQ
jgi:hypothetical protein